ncbi:FAD-binding protein [Paracoccus litorisediminis]|nr:FAD-binding protein [Paracoccus litorisediminis]
MRAGFSITTDVLVIGGGMAGAWAAIGARRAGASVVLVEKGWLGTSGVTATAGPGHWWVAPADRPAAIAKRLAQSGGLNDPVWMERILETTWEILPTLSDVYDFSRDEQGQPRYRALRGPEYMRALRRRLEQIGVTIIDHAPAQELLRHADGSIGGARGIRHPGGTDWQVESGAVVLATGGTSFRSHLLGSHNNTGDGYLMAAEAGAQLSGMEFTSVYCIAPARTTLTRSMSFAFATYYDEAGQVLPIGGPDITRPLAAALLRGPVFADLARTPADIRAQVPTISPNFLLPFRRWGIDPYTRKFEVTLHGEGTIRGIGGIAVEDRDCGAGVPGLFVAGDAATRELVAGAISGGGNINSAWALSSGQWAGAGAARFAARSTRRSGARGIGGTGLHPVGGPQIDAPAILAQVQDAMLSYDKALFRDGVRLRASLAVLDQAWSELAGSDLRELAAMTASARWSLLASITRAESRGIHQREDHSQPDPALARRIRVHGLDRPIAAPEPERQAA